MPNSASLPLLLKQLALPSIAKHWEDDEMLANEKHWTYAEYLTALCNKEATTRKQNRIQRHIHESKLPPGKTLDSFDFKSATTINPAQISALADNTAWVKNANNILLFGPSGVGKTHLAAAIGYRLIEQGIRVLFIKTNELVQKLQRAREEYRLPEAIAKLARIPLIILDDIGYVTKDSAETGVLFELIADRYETKSLIITSNQPFEKWGAFFPDGVMAVAAIDRLVHHATVINVKGDSFRQKQANAR